MQLLPLIRANVQERFLFNFRMPSAVLLSLLPVPWLRPHLVNDYAVVSFCTLNLRQITVAPLPTVAGLRSLSCAYRFAVTDTTRGEQPSVYVPARYTNSVFGSWFTHCGFCAPHPLVHARVELQRDTLRLCIAHTDGTPLFSVRFRAAAILKSALFASCDEFAAFIKAGVRSYGDSIRGNKLTVLDLQKTDTNFTPLEVLDLEEHFLTRHSGVQFDSALSTSGGRYQWTYKGLISGVEAAKAGAFVVAQ